MNGSNHLWRRGRVPFGILSILLVLFLNLLAAAPALHEQFHADAHQSGHQCAATLFAHGQVDAPVLDAVPPVPPVTVEVRRVFPVSLVNALVAELPPGRAPPVAFV